ncbi:MAG: T9SS type A sorting domain-containing protein [Saprospiraceae bacterium]
MKRIFTLLSLMAISLFAVAQDYIVQTVGATAFDPATLTINVGETVEFQNTGGFHNINGTQNTFPNNPESFGNDVGADWNYQYTFNTPGVYDYHCDPHQGDMIGQITVMDASGGGTGLMIAGVADPQPNNGSGSAGAGAKTIELYAIADIPDLSIYGLGAANNGGGTDGEEFTFPAVSLNQGDCILLTDTASLDKFQTFFGTDPDFLVPESGVTAINGDDAIELFRNGEVVDVFGNIDGTEPSWNYQDGWAYRVNGTGPDGSTFIESNWTYSGTDALQSDEFSLNIEFANPYPNCTYSPGGTVDLTANNDNVSTEVNTPINIDVLANDQTPNGVMSLEVTSISINGTAVANGTTDITYTPGPDFCGTDEYTYEICDATSCDEATITITIDCPVIYPAYTIGIVTADANNNGEADSIDVNCALTGVVYGTDIRGGNGLTFTIIDSNNDGINVFNFSDVGTYEPMEGEEVTINGSITSFNGLAEIIPEEITVNSTGNTLVIPTDVTSLGEDTESQLIRMTNMFIVDTVSNFGGYNIRITNGSVDTFIMRVDEDIDLYTLPAPTGVFNVTGIGGQFDNSGEPFDSGYQIGPRYVQDIEEVSSIETPAFAANIKIYPNPVSALLQIESEVALDEIRVTNVLGQSVELITEQNSTLSIDVSHLQSGLYFLTMFKDGESWTQSFIKRN